MLKNEHGCFFEHGLDGCGFPDSANRLSYFDFSFEAMIKLEVFDAYSKIEDYCCIDYQFLLEGLHVQEYHGSGAYKRFCIK